MSDSLNPHLNWYHLVPPGDPTLRQGDILFDLEYLCPSPYVWPPIDVSEPGLVEATMDVVVLTASCDLDLANKKKKIDYVLLCPHWDFNEAAKAPEITGVRPSNKGEIESGKMPRFYLLAASPFAECPMGLRVVDFNRLFQLPRNIVDEFFAGLRGPRLRLNSPYREHLAQSFGTCFTRVGLPLRASEITPTPSSPGPDIVAVSAEPARPASPEGSGCPK